VIKYCIDNNILKNYLQEYGSEVLNMIFGDGEYDRDMDIAVNRREAWEDGHEEGHKEGCEEGMEKGRQYFLELLNQDLTTEEIKQRLAQEEFFSHS